MDYSYYQNAPQAYQFLGLPPTPGHTGSAVSSEDYNNSPTVRAPSFHYAAPIISQSHLPHPQSEEFHQNPSPHYSHSHSHSHSHYHSSPSPHHQSPIQSDAQTQAFLTPRRQHDDFDQFQNFNFNPHFANGNTDLPKPAPIPQHRSSTGSNGKSAPLHNYDVNTYESNNAAAMDMANEEARRSAGNGQGGSNSDDDDMTPAQSRRKAQNRAA